MFYMKAVINRFQKFQKKETTFISVICFVSLFKYSFGEECIFQSTCECVFTNGSVIDLTELGYHNTPRFSGMKSSKDNYTYNYNPCYGFHMGPAKSDCAESNVAVCQVTGDSKQYFDCGDASSVIFKIINNTLHLIYRANERTTNVTLVCLNEAEEPILTVEGETSPSLYQMTLTTKCACPDMCRKSHLSAGSVLLIIFMIFVALYLVLGVVHSSLTRGAHGLELIPHYEFWADFPYLVRDGCVFFVDSCLRGNHERSYESI